jgi:large subunit ribosomal protein L21
MYAILSHGGRQYRVSAGDRLLVDRLTAEVGSVVGLEPVLLTGGDGDRAAIGTDVDGVRVAATVVAHVRGKKLRVFKYKAKKRTRKMAGYRSDLTELRVESILAKGAKLPAATKATSVAHAASDDDAPAKPAPRARARKAAAAAGDDTPAATAVAEPETIADAETDAAPAASEPTATASAADGTPATDDAPAAKPVARPRAPRATKKAKADNPETTDGA